MNVVVTTDQRYDRTPDGAVWTPGQSAYQFWTRYLDVFDGVRVVARVREVPTVPAGWLRADGEHVSIAAVPYYVGPWQYSRRAVMVRRAARRAVGPSDAVILRGGSGLAPALRRTGRPYAVEVVADPYDVFAPGAIRHPLRPLFRWWIPRELRRQCAGARAAAYVTEEALQRRYPPKPGAYSVAYSDVDLPEAAFVATPCALQNSVSPTRLITVGTLAQLYKAPDVLIDAVSLAVREGLDLRLTLVGDGKHQSELEARARDLDLGERVCFLGALPPGEAVRAQLDGADIFVLPSHQEGLPRAIIEAMARALPCIGSTVGGIPELLPAEDLVPPGDVSALAEKLREVATDPVRRARMSARNLERAKEYREDVLSERRIKFYCHVKGATEAWLKSQDASTGESRRDNVAPG